MSSNQPFLRAATHCRGIAGRAADLTYSSPVCHGTAVVHWQECSIFVLCSLQMSFLFSLTGIRHNNTIMPCDPLSQFLAAASAGNTIRLKELLVQGVSTQTIDPNLLGVRHFSSLHLGQCF
jgi:hypothetical protein